MGQLSLFTETTPSSKPAAPVVVGQWYCDVFVHSVWDEKRKRIRIKPLSGQAVSHELFVSCSHKARTRFPTGTVFKMDVRLVQGRKEKKYLVARAGRKMERALEYFEHNLTLQRNP